MNNSLTGIAAATNSLNASLSAMDKSGLDPFAVAYAVGMEAAQREAEFTKLHAPETPAKLKTPSLLGCYVNGELKFQSRDHDAIRAYAAEKMSPWTVKTKNGGYQVRTNNVWVAPVGSFAK